jgi:hypothetical protein
MRATEPQTTEIGTPPEMATTTPTAGFTADDLNSSATDVMLDPEVRPRVLQRVAEIRGISTAAALDYFNRTLVREAGVSATLGQVLNHLKTPHLDGPPGGAMLDQPIRALFADRTQLNRVVEAISKDQAVDYLAALTKLHEGVDEARGGTVRMALAAARLPTDGIEAGLRLLERRDAAADTAYFRALGSVEHTDARGLVLLDQGSDGGAPVDVGKALADPVEIERRLARIRKAQRGWEGDEGRERFLEADRANLETGGDIVATAERAGKIAAARSEANQVARHLDQAIREGTDQRSRMRLLDQEIDRLGIRLDSDPAPAVDVPASAGLRALDGSAPAGPALLTPELQIRIIRLREQGVPYDEARLKTLATVGADEIVWQSGQASVVPRSPAGEESPRPETPAGVHPASHELDQRIQARLRQEGKVIDGKVQSGEYVKTLEQILAEDSAALEGGR